VKELLKYIFNQNCEEVRRLKAFHELEMIEVTRQRDHLRQDHVRLTAHNRYLEVAHETRRAAADHDPLEGDLFRQNRIISDLMKRNATLTSDIPYIKEILLDQPKLLFREAKDTTLQIQSELESLAHIYEYQRPTATRITPGSKLEMLLKSVIGEEPDGAYSGKSMDLADWLGHFDVRLVVGHLVLTAVKKQVFYSDFPASGAKNFWWSLLQEHRIIQMDLGEFLGPLGH
jgi:hypothetical protein